MKRSIYLLSLIFLLACKDSGELDLSFPIFEVSSVAINSTTSITVDVDFIHVGTTEIIQHGFVWDWTRSPSLGTFQNPSTGRGFLFINGSPDFNGYSEEIETSFSRGQRHLIRAFVITASDTTYSTTRSVTPNP